MKKAQAHSPIRIPQKILKLPPQLPQPNLLCHILPAHLPYAILPPLPCMHDDMPPVQLECVALVDELVQVFGAHDGELRLVGACYDAGKICI